MSNIPALERCADWKGSERKRFRWSRLRFEFGRWCYQTDAFGGTVARWWEWRNV